MKIIFNENQQPYSYLKDYNFNCCAIKDSSSGELSFYSGKLIFEFTSSEETIVNIVNEQLKIGGINLDTLINSINNSLLVGSGEVKLQEGSKLRLVQMGDKFSISNFLTMLNTILSNAIQDLDIEVTSIEFNV